MTTPTPMTTTPASKPAASSRPRTSATRPTRHAASSAAWYVRRMPPSILDRSPLTQAARRGMMLPSRSLPNPRLTTQPNREQRAARVGVYLGRDRADNGGPLRAVESLP